MSVVDTEYGRLDGRRENGVLVFRGIPYARPPVGPLRFRHPELPEPWAGVRPAQRFGSSAPQRASGAAWMRALRGGGGSPAEDCLTLNIWTPGTDARRRPVLVWLHGGSFATGSGGSSLYAGYSLALRGDAVVVTLNYRLGVLGFLNLGDVLGDVLGEGTAEVAAPNCGLHDQLAALRFVRDNIAAFGGDPDRVTLFAESAGAMSAGALLGVPAAEGLFHRAILQSGAAHNVSSPTLAAGIAERFLRELGLGGGASPGAVADALRQASVPELLSAQQRVSERPRLPLGALAWQPSIDGALVPEAPLARIARGEGARVPLLVGSNRDEWKMFTMGDRKRRSLDRAGLEGLLLRTLDVGLRGPDAPRGREGPRAKVLAREALALYAEGGRSPADAWVAFQTDRVFAYPAMCLAELHARAGVPAYAYRFDWAPPVVRGSIGACHAMEIPFVFGAMSRWPLRALGFVASGTHSLCTSMQDAWLAFASAGSPGHTDLPAWPMYDAERRATLILNRAPELAHAPDEERLAFWRALDRVEAGGYLGTLP